MTRASHDARPALLDCIGIALEQLAASLRRLSAELERRQRIRDTYLALRELDARTLRDLGFHRSEIRSIAHDVAGTAAAVHARG